MVTIASDFDTCFGGLSYLEAGSMEVEGAPCLVEKALSMLIAMGVGKPKTLPRLENALRPCTRVVPFYNPFEALRTANAMLECPPPMVNMTYSKDQTYVAPTYKLDKDFLAEIQRNAEDGCVFDAAVKDGEVERSMIQEAQAWVHQCEKLEGTKEELLKDFFKCCTKKVHHSSLEVVKKLQAKGYLKIDGDNVSYSLPELWATVSSQLKRISDGQFWKDEELLRDDIDDLDDIKYTVCTWLANGSSENINPMDLYRNLGVDVTGNGPVEYLMDILVIQTLSTVMKPSNLTDLLDLIKPQSLTFVVLPRRMVKAVSKIERTQGKVKGKKKSLTNAKAKKREVAIGSPIGESRKRKQVPLTPEGLLGIDTRISVDTNSSVNSTQLDWTPNKQNVALQSKGFAASLRKRLAGQTSSCGAVLVPALECEKRVVVSRVIKWVNSYQSDGSCVKSELPTTVRLQNQLISLCTLKARKISPSSIVGCLQRFGYVTIDSESPHSISYHIPTAKTPRGLKSTPKAPWQLRANDFRQAVRKCGSVYIERAFPADVSNSKTSPGRRRKRTISEEEVCSKKQKSPIHEMV